MKILSCVIRCLLLAVVLVTQSLTQEYQPSAVAIQPVLTPQAPQSQAQTPPGFPQVDPPPAPAPAADPPVPSPPDEPKETLGTVGKDILHKFDDYLFKNLEDAYYRLSYAFEDAAKRALDDCGCHVGDKSASAGPPA